MKKKKTPTKIAKQIFDRKFQKLAGIPGQPGVNAASSAPSMSPPSAPRSLGRALPSPGLPKPLTDGLNTAGKAIWDNGGRQVMQNVVAPAADFGKNTLHGISTAGVGAANAAAGVVGSAGAGVGMLGSSVTDRMGLTKDMTPWIRDNVLRHTGNAIGAGLTDVAGATGDILSGGRYDHDGTFAGPEHSGTAVEQMRSGIRDELGRGSGFDTAFNAANAVGDFAANQAAFGGAGRGINVAARALRGSQLAAPALNAAAQTPVVGAPAAAAGRWLAGEAPAANMFQKGLVPYYRASGLQSVADDVYNAGNQIAQVTNPSDRTSDAREYQAQMAAATNEPPLQTQDTPQPDATQDAQTQAQQPPQASQAEVAVPSENTTPQTTPRRPFDEEAVTAQLQHEDPQVKAQGEKAVAEEIKTTATPENINAAKAIAQGDKETIQKGGAQFAEQQVAAAAESAPLEVKQNPNAFGEFIGKATEQAQQTWDSGFGFGAMGQAAFMLGVPVALISLMSGSGLMGILGGLGIAAAGFMGASSGLFGQAGQNFADDVKYNVGSALGMIPEVKKEDLAPLLSQNPLDEISKQSPKIDYAAAALNPEGYAGKVQTQIQQAEAQLQQLKNLAGQSPYFISKMTRLSPQEAELVRTNANAVLADAQNPQGQLGARLARAHEFVADPVAVRNREMQKNLGPVAARAGRFVADSVIPGGAKAINLVGQGLQQAGDYASQLLLKGGADMNIAQKIALSQTVQKAARCWAGYEPVPGKKPYSNDSCRPIGSKKKKKKTDIKNMRGGNS